MYDDHPQTFNRLCDSPNMYYDLLRAFVMLCGIQNWFAEPLQYLDRHYSSQNRQLSATLLVVKICLGNIYRPSTCFVVVKTGFLNHYTPSTSFGDDKLLC